MFHLPVQDTQSGLKVFSLKGRDALLDTRINRYLFDLELVRIATARKLKIGTLPLSLRQGIDIPGMPIKVLTNEFGNLIKLLLTKAK